MISIYRKKLDVLLAERRLLLHQVEQEESLLNKAKKHVGDCQLAQQLVQCVAQQIQQRAHEQIAKLVTYCLQAVFGEEAYSFRIDFERQRGKTSARFLLIRDGLEIEPLEAAGGGVVDVVSFGLRLACLLLGRPKRRLLLVLDEPFRHLSAEYIPEAREMLLALSREMGVQMILVTHNRELLVGKVVEL